MTQAESVLTILFDIKDPFCHLALPPSEKLIDELGLTVDWQPLLVPPFKSAPAPGEPFDRGTSHRWLRAQYIESDLQRYARALEIPAARFFDGGLSRPAEGAITAMAVLWLKDNDPGQVRPFLKSILAGYWDGDLAVDSAADVSAVIHNLQLPVAAFEEYLETSGPTELAAQQSTLCEQGYFTVPGYVVAGEIFYGREQLPMVRWLLTGKTGPPPI